MIKMTQRSFCIALACGVFALTTATGFAAKEKTEDELIAELASPKEGAVTSAMLKLERQFPTSEKAIAAIKKYLTDNRSAVRRKSARVLGAIHAEVTSAEIKTICALLKGTEPREVMDGLIALRGLKAREALPEILPLLQHSDLKVIGDACRTVAVHGSKGNIADIEPLLKHPNAKVQKEANDAIFILKAKS
jgi:HEAT repeat protein